MLRVLAHVCLGRTVEAALAASNELAPFEPHEVPSPTDALHASLPASLSASIEPPCEASDVAVYLGAAYETLLEASATRRTTGAHHTHPELAREVLRLAAAPFAGEERALRVCDPAVGSGVFLVEALGLFATPDEVDAWICERLFGVDIDPLAVFTTRVALFALSSRSAEVERALAMNIVCADFVSAAQGDGLAWLARVNLFVGNPPWIAYKGRAAAKLEPARRAYLISSSAAFAGYPTLHGVFIERCARALPPRGRLGLVVPTSVADLDGYAPTRSAHDRHCAVDPELPDYGARAFDGVFQPAMALLSTAREAPAMPGEDTWELARDDLDDATRSLLDRVASLPRLPSELFGERGIQTSADDRTRLSKTCTRRFTQPLLSGTEVRPFELLDAGTFVAPRDFEARLRTDAEWASVSLLIRQTARFPIAARANGLPFRNSILAGFATKDIDADALLALLNATPMRFLHYQRFRDARQGMPQLKIGHLRRLPLPSASPAFFADLARLGREIEATRRNKRDVLELERALDDLVSGQLATTDGERDAIRRWALGPGRVPDSRRRAAET